MNKVEINSTEANIHFRMGDIVVYDFRCFYIVAKSKSSQDKLVFINLENGNVWSEDSLFGTSSPTEWKQFKGTIELTTE